MKNYLLCLLLAGVLHCYAQDKKQAFITAVSFNPTVALALDNTAMFGAERRISQRLVLVLDAGYVFATSHYRNLNVNNTSGFAIRPGIRWVGKKDPRSYLAVQAFYKQVGYKMYDWLGKDCVNGVPSYEQLQSFVFQRRSLSVNLMAGWQFDLGGNLLLDLYTGAGIKWINRQVQEPNSCFSQLEDQGAFFEVRDGVPTINLPIGIKLLYRFE